MECLKRLFGKRQHKEKNVADHLNSKMAEIRSTESVGGIHYTDSVEDVKQLKREGRNQEAIQILLRSVEATEAESGQAGKGWGVAPWYYEQLAILYRKEKLYQKEVKILERYSKQPKAPGAGPQKLASRLEKAKELVAKHGV